MKLIEINSVSKILEDDIESPPVDFFSPEEEEKVAEYVTNVFFQKNKASSLIVGAEFHKRLKEGIEVNCVQVINTYKNLKYKKPSISGKMGRFAFFREPVKIDLKNKKLNDIAESFIRLVEANLEFYNKTCVDGFQLTMDDVIEHVKKSNKK